MHNTSRSHGNLTFRPTRPAIGVLRILLMIAAFAGTGDGRVVEPVPTVTVARVQYRGGGDWYNGPTEIPNLLNFVRRATSIRAAADEAQVEIMSEDLFAYPILFLTGHGNIRFTDEEVRRLRIYLENGGFLLANDDYGMDESFRREMNRVFPDRRMVELPPSHGIFQSPFRFSQGLPKIHEHDDKPPQAFGLFHEGRLVVFYAYESDIADGWDDPDIHGDAADRRTLALKMGANILTWALTH